jgi:excisionase family DNA binding protein
MALPSNAKPKFKAFWTVRSLAKDIDVSERTVHRWIDAGDLIVHRFGRSVRISDNDRRAFLAAHRGV